MTSQRGAHGTARDRAGMSLIEAMVGMMVLASASVMMSSSISSSQGQMEAGRRTSDATGVAVQQLDWLASAPEALSAPTAMSTLEFRTLYAQAAIVSIPTVLGTANSIVVPPSTTIMSETQRLFSGFAADGTTPDLRDHEVQVRMAKVGQVSPRVFGEDIRKYQIDVYKRPPGGARGGLLYRSSLVAGRLDPRSLEGR